RLTDHVCQDQRDRRAGNKYDRAGFLALEKFLERFGKPLSAYLFDHRSAVEKPHARHTVSGCRLNAGGTTELSKTSNAADSADGSGWASAHSASELRKALISFAVASSSSAVAAPL